MKRPIDLICSGLGLIVLSPVFGVLALWIKLDSSGPIFYRGVRVGRHGKAFRMFKFRSMVQNADIYSPEQKRVLSVRPGITDYASLRFQDEGKLLAGSSDPDKDYLEKIHPEKMRLSLEYVRKQSFWLDCEILARTLVAVVVGSRRRAPRINAESNVPTEIVPHHGN